MLTNQAIYSPTTPPISDDDQVLVQSAQKNMAHFALLYQRHVSAVYRYLLFRVGNEADAQDLTSQTFMAAMEGLAKFSGQKPFRAWLFGIARHKTMDQFRRQKTAVHLEEVEMLDDNSDDISDIVGRQLYMERIAEKLRILAPERAEAITLRLFSGLEVAEIATIMGKNEAAIRMLVFRGLRDLQGQLQAIREEQ